MSAAVAPAPGAPSQRKVATAQEAHALVSEALRALDDLDATLADETARMGAGRINEALALGTIKQERSGAYLRALQSVKANAVALARLAPDGVAALRKRHAAFTQRLHLNQTVIATVRSVSETLIRSLQDEAQGARSLSVYGPGAAVRRAPTSAPLALSVRL